MKYAIEQRLRFIDFVLFHYGTLNRIVLMDYFGISSPQASRDIQDYTAKAPRNIVYDNRGKCYIVSNSFKRVWE